MKTSLRHGTTVRENQEALISRVQATKKWEGGGEVVQCEEPISCSHMSHSTCSSVLSDCADGYRDCVADRQPPSLIWVTDVPLA